MGWSTQGPCARVFHAAACVLTLLSAMAAEVPEKFLPENATVVLLSGLPGDLESETAYHDHLVSWLDLLFQQGRPARVIVLSDSTNNLVLPEKATHLPATKTNFIGLAAQLRGGNDPLLVVAWGHGGKQGGTPVFHVRGPRITPEDFATLAEQSAVPFSRWILIFRGSGAFAAKIAGNSRQIVSSDAGSMFGSDPVAMTPLLKLLRAAPSAPFDSTLADLGRLTARWYEDRTLARTEEPALWDGTQKARLLADAGTGTAVAAGERTPVQAEAGETSDPAKTPDPAPPSSLPAAWSRIEKVSPEAYPDADAVSLFRKTAFTLGQNPAISGEIEDYIQVLTLEGKRFGDFDISYHPPQEDLVFLDCEVLRPDGRLVRLDPDEIREAREESVGQYQLGQRKFFSLPGIGPGAILHVRYRSSWKTFPMPHVSMALPLAGDIPHVRQTLEISLPKDAPFHFAFENVPVGDPAVRQSDYGTTYTWPITNTPPIERDVLMSPGQRPQVLFSSFPDWSAFASWYHRLTQMTGTAGEELAAKARELTASARDNRDKILAVYNYVTSMRYVAVPLGVNSLRPHSAENVFRNQFGDCKDKANLFNAMLRELGFEADLVLVPRFGQAHQNIPGLAFNHAISRVSLTNEVLWVDTTDDVCRFGMLPPGDPGRKVLVIDGVTTNLVQLPTPRPADHTLSLKSGIRLGGNAESCPAEITLKARGYPDYALRTARQSPHAGSLPLLCAEYQPSAGLFALEKQSSSSVSALEEDFTWEGRGNFTGLVSAAGKDTVAVAPFWLPDDWFLSLHARTSPLFLNRGYPIILDQELTIQIPAGMVTECPPVAGSQSSPLLWQLEWRQVSPESVTARLRAELSQGELDLASTRQFQEQLRRLIAACSAPLRLTKK